VENDGIVTLATNWLGTFWHRMEAQFLNFHFKKLKIFQHLLNVNGIFDVLFKGTYPLYPYDVNVNCGIYFLKKRDL